MKGGVGSARMHEELARAVAVRFVRLVIHGYARARHRFPGPFQFAAARLGRAFLDDGIESEVGRLEFATKKSPLKKDEKKVESRAVFTDAQSERTEEPIETARELTLGRSDEAIAGRRADRRLDRLATVVVDIVQVAGAARSLITLKICSNLFVWN